MLELKEDRETYWVDPSLWPPLATEPTYGPRALFTAISRQGALFLWPIRLPGPDGKIDDWNRTALEAAVRAAGKWVRFSAHMAIGGYEFGEAIADIPAPDWPDLSSQEILPIAFKNRLITSLDHPVLQRFSWFSAHQWGVGTRRMEPEKRRRGGQPGHRRPTRPLFPPEEVNTTWLYEWTTVPTGWKSLERFRVLQQIQLAEKPYKVTEYRARLYQNLRTDQVLAAPLPSQKQVLGQRSCSSVHTGESTAAWRLVLP